MMILRFVMHHADFIMVIKTILALIVLLPDVLFHPRWHLIPTVDDCRTWEGSQVHPDQGWLPSRLLAEAQQLEAPQETLTEPGGCGGLTGCDLWTTAGKSRPPPSVNNKRGSRLVDEKRLDKNTISQILLLHAAFKLCPEYMLTWCSFKSVISSDFLCPLPTT